MVGVTATGNSLTKTAATAWGNAGAVSTSQIASGDGYVEFTASETSDLQDARAVQRKHQRLLRRHRLRPLPVRRTDPGLRERHLKGTFGTYVAGDKLRVAVVGGVVKYSRNGTVFYTSTKTPAYPLLVDTALYTQGATLNSAFISTTP